MQIEDKFILGALSQSSMPQKCGEEEWDMHAKIKINIFLKQKKNIRLNITSSCIFVYTNIYDTLILLYNKRAIVT